MSVFKFYWLLFEVYQQFETKLHMLLTHCAWPSHKCGFGCAGLIEVRRCKNLKFQRYENTDYQHFCTKVRTAHNCVYCYVLKKKMCVWLLNHTVWKVQSLPWTPTFQAYSLCEDLLLTWCCWWSCWFIRVVSATIATKRTCRKTSEHHGSHHIIHQRFLFYFRGLCTVEEKKSN